jgi:hypothetical protein
LDYVFELIPAIGAYTSRQNRIVDPYFRLMQGFHVTITLTSTFQFVNNTVPAELIQYCTDGSSLPQSNPNLRHEYASSHLPISIKNYIFYFPFITYAAGAPSHFHFLTG